MKKTRLFIVVGLLGSTLGFLLGTMGYGADTWQFYAVYGLLFLFQVNWFIYEQ